MKVIVDLEILAEFLSKALGDTTEVAVHSLDDLGESLCILKNGHITGRHEKMGLTDLALDMLRDKSQDFDAPYKINYSSQTSDGRTLRSSTVIFHDDAQNPKAILCLNHDDAHFHHMINHLQKITNIDDHESNENFSADITKMGESIILEVMAENYTAVEKLTAQEKQELVAKMVHAGAFEVKGSVEVAARVLKVSEPTLYRYLKKA